MLSWEPPAGWSVITLKKAKPCFRCGRSLTRGTENLIQSMFGKHRFRCVDTDDCQQVRSWGGHPVYRKRLTELAASMDQART